ncbi:MAG: radical SAM protein [Christensenellales bacterium]
MECDCCPRLCKVDRSVNVGYCGMGDKIRLAKVQKHFWEEPFISGDKGSGTIFFSGCNLKCVYCQNYSVSRGYGKDIDVHRLAEIFAQLESSGVHNVNLVTGTHFVRQIVDALQIYRPKIPIVFNCGGYESENTLSMLDGLVDVYLPDFKYSDEKLAQKYSNAPDYFTVACKAIETMQRQVGKSDIVDGIMRKGVCVRHLVLPGCLDNTYGVLEWLKDNLDDSHYISLMGQYYPCGDSEKYVELNRRLKPLEYKLAISKAEKLGLANVLIQDLSSADADFTPDFDLQGV